MSDTRLWITGVGLVTPLGRDVEQSWGRLVLGHSGIAPLRLFGTEGYRSEIAASVADVSVPDDAPSVSRTSVMAERAAREAIAMSRIDPRKTRVGLVVGGTTGGMFETEELLARLCVERDEARPESLRCHPLSAIGDALENALGPFARIRTIASACSTGANALVVAASWLLSGEVDAVVAGGCDGLCRLTYSGFSALGVLSPEPCRPFDEGRKGMNLGEGAGFVVLETASMARARLSEPVAELAGWSVRSDAYHLTNPEPTGASVARAIERALACARILPTSIDYVNAHGTATRQNDAMESLALSLSILDHGSSPLVSSSKGQIGHTLAAAGAIEAIITALAVRRSVIPPHVGVVAKDPEVPLRLASAVGIGGRVRAALSNSFGFGGMNTVLVVTEPEFGPPLSTGGARVVVTGAVSRERESADLESSLDPERSRRLGRLAQLVTSVSEETLRAASVAHDDVGVVFGNALGNLDGCGAYLHRLATKGPRFASPAEFPNLVPSAVAGHVSIYCGLRGPSMVSSDLVQSSEGAIALACDLVLSGEANVLLSGGVQIASPLLERCFGPELELCADQRIEEMVGVLAFENEISARARGALVLARVVQTVEWRGEPLAELQRLAGPSVHEAEVVILRGNLRELVQESLWSEAPVHESPSAPGEARAAVVLARAAQRIAGGQMGTTLVLGGDERGGYAFVLARA